jgi:hypothetical protein
VAITGHADDGGRKAALETRFDVHVPKPGDASNLEQFLIKRGIDGQTSAMSGEAPSNDCLWKCGPPSRAQTECPRRPAPFYRSVAALALPPHNLSRARHLITGNHSSASGAALAAPRFLTCGVARGPIDWLHGPATLPRWRLQWL